MGLLREIFAAPASWLYGAAVSFRHSLFNWGVKKSVEFDIPIVVVGNITVGGTGKTPMTEYLVRFLSEKYNVAVLSRGYGRKTKGFLEVKPRMSYKKVGDEPKQIKMNFPHIPVVVCEKRVEGIRRLREIHPEVNLIILDDAFQHRYVEGWVNIVLMDYNLPVYEDRLLPLGRLRDVKGALRRANILVVTKCPYDLTPLDCRLVRNNLDLYPYQTLYFSRSQNQRARPLFAGAAEHKELPFGSEVVAMATIANPTNFLEYVEQNYKLSSELIFPDHHRMKNRDIEKLEAMLKVAPKGAVVVMTEKDAVKLFSASGLSQELRSKLYYISVSMHLLDNGYDGFASIVTKYVSENYKYKLLHPKE